MWRYVPYASCCSCIVFVSSVADFRASDSTICPFGCINFTDLSTNANSWSWTFSGGTPLSSTVQNPQNVCYLSSGIYSVKLVASNSGGSDSITISNFIHVSPLPPLPGLTQSGDTLECSTDTSYAAY